ncbi:SLC13 family permease [Rhodovulum adriaticum]|uniref:Di/tricarboxylate transporter n=1 Tax=Rhodovulum adriaticum TaxID=35804 RepID=A0A4R2NHC5_RHOAD|nr:SLC13 family permease [Rhodovulum adriaticum]MBK1637226.1 sodium:sulfate symporter [Rhodovulum adriaticum]TCP20658.1 di/tricarboxylate transporter [Rhodovulum adriaticum]
MRHGNQILFAVILGVAAVLALRPLPGVTPDQGAVMAIVLVTLGLWGTGLLAPYLSTLIFFAALLVGGLATPETVFAGFSSAAMWLVMSGFVIGAAITGSGLGARLGAALAPHLSKSYTALIAGLVGLGVILSFLMPSSMGRAMVMVPLGMGLAEALGFARGSNGRIGVAVAIAMASNLPGFAILPANIPNMVLTGASDRLLGLQLGYADYLILHFPVLGLGKSILLIWLILRLFPATAGASLPAQPADTGTARRVWLTVLLAMTLALWATDKLHGINPAWIGMTLAVVLLMPRIGFVSGPGFREAVDFGTLLFVAGALALGAVVSASGLGEVLANLVLQGLPLAPGQDFSNFIALSGLGAVTALLTTQPGVPAVLTPLAPDLAAATGLSLEAVVMTQVVGFSTVVFPYQAAPLIVAMGLSKEPLSALVRVTLLTAAVTLLILLPLDFLWWRLLGWL